jgi:hypothetical protein
MVTSSSVPAIAQESTPAVKSRAAAAAVRRWLGVAAVCAVATAPMLAYAAWRWT